MASSISSSTSTAATASTTSTASTGSKTTSSLTSSLFQASGIASGLDTNTIVNSLIQAQSGPLNQLRQRQADYAVQISTAGTVVSQLKDLQTAAADLAKNGVVSIQPTESYSDFTVSGSAKTETSYAISVQQLAKQAKMRSASFTSAQDDTVVPDGNLQFSIDGTNTATIDTKGKTLADIAEAINQGISGLSASVISTTTGYYLNVSRKDTGYAKATGQAAALTVVSDPGLGLATQQSAQNAQLTIDGLTVERTSNDVSDVVAGVTIHLTGQSGVENDVSFSANKSNTETALNTFVTAYNTLAATVKSQLVTDPSQSYGDTLLGHSEMTTIQSAMQRMLSQVVVPSGAVRTLADLGLELQRDGSLSLNPLTLDKAVSSSAGAANAIFSTAKTGISAVVKSLVDNQTGPLTGALVMEQKSLQSQISDLDDRATSMQSNLDATRERLVAQFTAMEQLIAGFNSAGTYLTQIANLKISS
jgi:flagellar hook-associated protein 2